MESSQEALLLDPVLRSTMTVKEKTDGYNQANQILIPNKHYKVVTDEDPFISTRTTISNSTTVTNTDHSSIIYPLISGSDELNFSSGMSQYCLKAYLANEQLQESRESIRNDMATGSLSSSN